MIWFPIFLVVVILIFTNAFYVAAEFSSVVSRRPRLVQYAEEGNKHAAYLLGIVESPQKLDDYIATCQVGITISSLVLGFYGQGSVAAAITPYLARLGNMGEVAAASISATVILIFFSLLQILFGELIPKNIGIQYPERLALLTTVPMRISAAFFRPLIWIFNGSSQVIMRIFGQEVVSEYAHVHAAEEILMLVEESGAGGVLQREEQRLLKNTLLMRDSLVRQVMNPRTRMLAAPASLSREEMFSLLAESDFSRLPLYEGSIDHILGVIHLKDLLFLDEHTNTATVQEVMRPVPLIPETMTVREAFSMLQNKRLHIAIVLDEFGGTSGMVTLEDLVEEIFGELQDEFDIYTPMIKLVANQQAWIRGDTLIEFLNEKLNLRLPHDDVDTIGGLVLTQTGYVPKEGEEIEVDSVQFRVEKMSGRGIAAVTMPLTPEQVSLLQEENG